MKKLNMFQKFDFVAWQKGKKFMISAVKYNEKKDCVRLLSNYGKCRFRWQCPKMIPKTSAALATGFS